MPFPGGYLSQEEWDAREQRANDRVKRDGPVTALEVATGAVLARHPLIASIIFVVSLAALLWLVNIGKAEAEDTLPWPTAFGPAALGAPAPEQLTWNGPMLVCWQAERLIEALQPGAQGIPAYCDTIESPTFQIQERVWTTPEPLTRGDGTRWVAAVYRIVVANRHGEFFTALAEPAAP